MLQCNSESRRGRQQLYFNIISRSMSHVTVSLCELKKRNCSLSFLLQRAKVLHFVNLNNKTRRGKKAAVRPKVTISQKYAFNCRNSRHGFSNRAKIRHVDYFLSACQFWHNEVHLRVHAKQNRKGDTLSILQHALARYCGYYSKPLLTEGWSCECGS